MNVIVSVVCSQGAVALIFNVEITPVSIAHVHPTAPLAGCVSASRLNALFSDASRPFLAGHRCEGVSRPTTAVRRQRLYPIAGQPHHSAVKPAMRWAKERHYPTREHSPIFSHLRSTDGVSIVFRCQNEPEVL